MHKNLLILLLLALAATSCKKANTDNAAEYSDSINRQNNRVITEIEAFYGALEEDNYQQAEIARQRILMICDSVVLELNKIGGFEEDSSFQQAAITYVKKLKEIADAEFKTILQSSEATTRFTESLGLDETAADSLAYYYNQLDSAYNSMDTKDSIYFEQVEAAQKKFAFRQKLEIIEGDKLQQ